VVGEEGFSGGGLCHLPLGVFMVSAWEFSCLGGCAMILQLDDGQGVFQHAELYGSGFSCVIDGPKSVMRRTTSCFDCTTSPLSYENDWCAARD